MENAVYLDHNATTPVRPEAVDAAMAALALTGNPSSVHRHGRLARRIVEDARDRVAALAGAEPADVVFTSGGSEANSLAVRGSGRARVLVSAVEHLSVLAAGEHPEIVPVNRRGQVDLRALETMLGADSTPALVSVMLVNNETGIIQPIAAVAEIALRHGALVHCDAAQAAGKIPIDMMSLGVHMLTLSAHKMGGVPGCGALAARSDTAPRAQIRGGGQERGRRAGSENLAGIAGFGAAAEIAAALPDVDRIAGLRDMLERAVRDRAPSARILGSDSPRVANTSCVSMPGVPSETQVMALDLAGVSVSAGSACSSGKVARSHVLEAMGVGDDDANGAIRVSLGWTTSERDIKRFLDAWRTLYARLGERGAAAATAPAA
jgi:cysteine desulfurase